MTIAERDQQEQFEQDILDDKPASRMLAAVDKANPPAPLACFMLPNSTIVGSMKAGGVEISWTVWPFFFVDPDATFKIAILRFMMAHLNCS